MKKTNNTLDTGVVRCLIYYSPEEKIYYGTALELNITVSYDNEEEAWLELKEEVQDYIKEARELNAPKLLNQKVDKELEEMWQSLSNNAPSDNKRMSKVVTPFVPLYASTSPIPA